ncbi:MAG: disulfide bond formation protein B [Porticoccaceae bacterium]|nr:disulfide bond formation protein B [Pseudomonadales bacterium]MCP5172843.1 disulfide bond formation protein B [Pseudomonadales bacterium]MCP5302317.1 disulfide bond formation protein B [Pseudomonadales bacterium]
MPSTRIMNLLIFVSSAAIIATALYMQHVMELTPCYLCITQRVFFITIGALGLLAFLHNPKAAGSRIYATLTAFLSVAGGYFSGKQLWLQSLPEDQVPACGPPAEYLFEAFPLSEALSMLLRGDGNCAKVQWTFLDISIPGWALVAFVGFLVVAILQMLRKDLPT